MIYLILMRKPKMTNRIISKTNSYKTRMVAMNE